MLLSKEIAVNLNLSACKLKQYTSAMLKKGNIDLTPEQLLMLDLLWNLGPMSQQKVADTMHKDKNSITKLADALVAKGMLERERNEKDKRSNILHLTDKAEHMRNDTKEAGILMLDKILDGISERELRKFLTILDKLTRNMSM